MVSNGEYMPVMQTEKQRSVQARIDELVDSASTKLGVSRRRFLTSSGGMAAAFLAMNEVFGPVFNVNAEDLGATLSATSVDSDIAATVVSVARRVVDGDSNSIPDMTPLNEIDVQTNRAIIRKSELAAAIDEGAR